MPDTRWFSWKKSVCENQKIESWVRTLPRSGMPFGKTRSNAEMRSVATMISLSSSSSYVSLTLPRANTFNGKSVVVTGTIEGFSREETEQAVRDAGGKPAGSVSKKTDYIVAGPGAGTKLAKAEELGIPILDAEGFRKLLAGEAT